MRILVTGSEGFIGSHLVESLIKRKYQVKALTLYNFRNSFGWLDALDPAIKKKIEIIPGDIRDLNFVRNISNNVDSIIHLAALISIPYSYISPKSYIDTNINGTYNILEAARINKVKKIIIASSSEVYGTANFVPITENHSLNAQSPYAASKIAADQIAISFFKSYNLPVTIIRPFNTFGPRQSIRAIIPNIILQAISKKRIVEVGNLFPTRDFTYVDDTVNGFVKALKNRDSNGQVINLGSGFEVSIKEIINILKKDFKLDFKIIKDEKRIRPARSEVIRLLACNKKAKNILNWKPQFIGISGFKKNLKKTLEWYKKNNYESYKPEIFNI
jgi:NAD dependent epimerase/dehydratase